jgi:tetratricopeptide (TPR) repeat protein
LDLPPGDPLADALDFTSAERRLFADAADGHFDEHSLLDAALIACGANDPIAIERYRQKFAELRDDLRRADQSKSTESSSGSFAADFTPSPPAGEGRGEGAALRKYQQIHQVLHHLLLRTYDANATDLATTFDTGVYNCASATLLYVALAGEVGLNARAVELPGHVRVEANAGDDRYEIEITCPTWPDAVRRLSSPSPRGEGRGEGDAADANRRQVSSLGLVAMIYYNRGIDAFYDHRYTDAVAANRRALLLDPDNSTARGNLLAAVNNWALALSDAGRYADAETLLAAGLRYDPTHEPFTHNAAHVQQLWSQSQSAARVLHP